MSMSQSKYLQMHGPPPAHNRHSLLLAAAFFFSLTMVAAVVFGLYGGDITLSFENLYLWPWILMAFVVFSAPPVYLMLRRRFDPFHPLVYASWTYFLPAFVLGSIFLATGISEPSFLHLIPDQRFYLPLTLVYVALGYLGLTIGFALPWGKPIGDKLSRRMSIWNWRPSDLLFPCGLLLIIGQLFSLTALSAGALGFQRVETVDTFNATLSSLSTLVSMATFILWFAIFRASRLTFNFKVMAFFLIVLIPYSAIISGSRGGLLYSMIPIAMAYWLSGRRFKVRQALIFGALGTIALLVGMVYGSTFRFVKGVEDRVDINIYLKASSQAVGVIGDRSIGENLSFGFAQLSERFETTSSLAVVVANYEKLNQYEADYGIANNIWTYTWTAFIPRFLWNDKPLISDARAYSALYFDFGENSFALTPIGDLLRNFGPVGIPLGMALWGFLLRIIYSALIDGKVVTAWRAVAYLMLFGSFTYESFYGTILPTLIRNCVILMLGGLLINALVRRRGAA
jgi:oligosaccharide repeat unit polymerase